VEGDKVTSVRITNVPPISRKKASRSMCRISARSSIDVSYGGNYYAIIEPQGAYTGLDDLGASRIDRTQPHDPRSWCATSLRAGPSARSDHPRRQPCPVGRQAEGRGRRRTQCRLLRRRAIDRIPVRHRHLGPACAPDGKGRLKVGDRFVHESYIGSRFIGRVEET
jgi:4-hydroxyproline epimerase